MKFMYACCAFPLAILPSQLYAGAHEICQRMILGFTGEPLIERYYIPGPPPWIKEFHQRVRQRDETVVYHLLRQRATELENLAISEVFEIGVSGKAIALDQIQAGGKYRVKLGDGSSGVIKVSHHGDRADASVQAEVAAYRLAYAIGLELVPPTVFREVNGHSVSLQDFVGDPLGADSNLQVPTRQIPISHDQIKRMLFEYLDDGDMILFYTVFGQWDGHPGNRIRRANGRLRLIDNEEIGRQSFMTLDGLRLTERGRTVNMPGLVGVSPQDIAERIQTIEATHFSLFSLLKQVMSPSQAENLAAKIVHDADQGRYRIDKRIHYAWIIGEDGVRRLFLEVRKSSNPLQLFRSVTFLNDPTIGRMRGLNLIKLDEILPLSQFPHFDLNWRATVGDRIRRLDMQILRASYDGWISYGSVRRVYPDLIYDERQSPGHLIEYFNGERVR